MTADRDAVEQALAGHRYRDVLGDCCSCGWEQDTLGMSGRSRRGAHDAHVAEHLAALIEQAAGEREAAWRERVGRLADSIEGESGVAHNYGCEGEPECLACIVADLRAVLDADDQTGGGA